MEPTWLAVGLGNPGRRYELTRHNAGARAIERLAGRLGEALRPSRTPALVAETRAEGVRVVLARPTTWMNESGRAVAGLTRYYGADADHLIVLHDELDLKLGILRLKKGGGTAGHHGLDSIVHDLGTRDFYRVRIGVGRPPGGKEPADWLLERMTKREAGILAPAEEEGGEAVLGLIAKGLERAMNLFNTR